MTDIDDRLDRLESLVEQQQDQIDDQRATIEAQQETIERQRERIDRLEAHEQTDDATADEPALVNRRTALKAGGLLALLGVGAGTASADPQGQVGTGDDPIETLHAAAIDGPLTDGVRLDSLVGEGLAVRDGTLTNAIDVPALTVSELSVPSFSEETEPFTVDATVEESADIQTDGLTITLVISAGDGQVVEETVAPADIRDDDVAVTFGDDSPFGPLEGDEYTATVTADARNAELATASEAFTVATQFAGGNGSSESPFEIETWHNLDNVREELGKEFVLVTDLDAGTAGYDDVASETANDGNGFDPIGDTSDFFTGTFDGAGHTITDLTIDRSEPYAGLFASQEGTVESVTLRNVSVTAKYAVGALVGYNYGGTVRDVLVEGSVTGEDRTGGLAGESSGGGTIERAAASVTTSGPQAGGLVGNQGTGVLRESYATGDVDGATSAGGVVGDYSGGTIEHTYATGQVGGDVDVGGLVGYSDTSVTDSYWDTDSTDQGTSAGNATGLTTDEMQGDEADDNLAGFDFPGTWATVDAENDDVSSDDYPVLAALDRATQLEVRE